MDSPAAPQKTSGLAITSLILGIFSVFCCGALLGIPAVILGHVSRGRIKSSAGTLKGSGLAMGGLITGYLSLVLTILFSVAVAPHLPAIIAKARAGAPLVHGLQIETAATKAGVWPADAGITSTTGLIEALVARNGLTQAEAASLNPSELLVGNVSASDPASTIFVRSKPGLLQDGSVVVVTKSGGIEFYDNEAEIRVPAPPRQPEFLTP